MRVRWLLFITVILLFTLTNVKATPYPLYVRYIPYTPPNLHLRTTRATTAYYLPSLNQGVTYNFTTDNLLAPIRFVSGSIPMRMAVFRGAAGCTGIKTVQVDLQFRIGGAFVTVATTTQTIFVPFFGNIVPVFTINGLQLSQAYLLAAGDAVRLRITPTAGGRLCLVNEYPTGGSDQDATHVVLSAGPIFSMTKASAVINDPVNGPTNPKRIPGALVEYTINVANQATIAGDGENTTISDPIPPNMTYVPGSITVDGAPQTDAIDGDLADFSGGTVNVNFGNFPLNTSHTVRFRATID